jgi:hypothetical protein
MREMALLAPVSHEDWYRAPRTAVASMALAYDRIVAGRYLTGVPAKQAVQPALPPPPLAVAERAIVAATIVGMCLTAMAASAHRLAALR